VEFNPGRVVTWRQIGYTRHQLRQEHFRDNTVDAAEIGARESGNALYVVQLDRQGEGPIGVLRVRYRVPATGEFQEQEWSLPYAPDAPALDRASPALRLATAAAGFAEWLAASPFAQEVTTDGLLALLRGVAEHFAPDPRPARLAEMIRAAGAMTGR
jgi:hypothetical protein